jgi:hypothetical protein
MTVRVMSRILIVVLAVAFLVSGGSAAAETIWNLTGEWQGSAGNDMSLRQSGTTVTWFAHSGDPEAWAHDFTGAISGDSISGTFQDRPGYQVHNRGRITARIIDDCHFVITGVGLNDSPLTGGGERFTKTPCGGARPAPVPISTVANGCGGAGWASVVAVQNYLGNTSKYANSNVNPLARTYTVNLKDACDLHDAGYAGAVVHDKINGGLVVDYRTWSRKRVDAKFLDDMRRLCTRQIPATAFIALRNCKASGGNASFGAESRFDFVRRFGYRFFDADVSRGGTQRSGPRANN